MVAAEVPQDLEQRWEQISQRGGGCVRAGARAWVPGCVRVLSSGRWMRWCAGANSYWQILRKFETCVKHNHYFKIM